jgi:hypothetical protein
MRAEGARNIRYITELERQHVVEMIDQALAEMEESEEFSQGAIDGLYDVLRILGVKNVEVHSKRPSRDSYVMPADSTDEFD